MILAIFAVGKTHSRRRPSAIHFFFTSIEIPRDYGFFIRDWSISIDIFGLRNNLFLGIYCLKIFLGEFFDDLFKPLASPKYLPRRHEDDGVGESAIQSSSSINIKHHHYHPHRHQKHHHLHQKHHHYQDAMRIAEMAPRRDLHCQSMQVVKASFHWDPRRPCQQLVIVTVVMMQSIAKGQSPLLNIAKLQKKQSAWPNLESNSAKLDWAILAN